MGQANPVNELEIDRKLQKQLQARFLELNEKRKTLLHQNTSDAEQSFIQLLPFLFHINHPTLPGFVQLDTPCGIAHYKPTESTINLARRYSRSLNYQPDLMADSLIDGIYLMGSAGSVAHTASSDLDAWVVYRSDLDEKQLKLLRKKRNLIEAWATKQGVDVSIFLVTPGRILDDSSGSDRGSRQSALLLDEFYRTQIYLAGKLLLWWLVPPEWDHEYENYKTRLINNKYIQADHWIDFGRVDDIPLTEFIGNALWYINKALISPYKTALKLVLMESYLSQYPNIEPLSKDYKSFVYNMIDNATVVDAYLLMHHKVEQYLLEHQKNDRLEFVRRCLYQKVQVRLSQDTRRTNQSRIIIKELVDQWQWTSDKQRLFDSRNQWDIYQIGNEKRLYVKQLISSFRNIAEYIKNKQEIFEQYEAMLTCLGRKIGAHLELTDGKIELVNINFVPELAERHLSIVRQTKAKDLELWSFYDRAVSASDSQSVEPVYQCGSLLELLVWAKVNGLVHEGTALQYKDSMQQLHYDELEHLVRILAQTDLRPTERDDSIYLHAPKIHEISCFINVAHDRLTTIAKDGVYIISQSDDPLSYGKEGFNLIETVDLFYTNSWGEMFVVSFKGDDSLSEAGIALLELSERQDLVPTIKYHSFSSMRAEKTVNRVRGFYNHMVESFNSQHTDRIKFVYRLGNEYRAIYKKGEHYNFARAAGLDDLAEVMANSQGHVSYCQAEQQLVMDPKCFHDAVVRFALQKAEPGDITLLINRLFRDQVTACLVDQHGGCVYFYLSKLYLGREICQLADFICNSTGNNEFRKTLRCFDLQQDGSVRPHKITITPSAADLSLAIDLHNLSDKSEITFHCRGKSLTVTNPDKAIQQLTIWLDRSWNLRPEQLYINQIECIDSEVAPNYAELILLREQWSKQLLPELVDDLES